MGIKDTKAFRKYAIKAFKEIDMDNTGHVDYKEVCIGILKIYDNLNMKFPAHVPAPKRTDMLDMCRKFDKNENGTICEEEFIEMAKVLIGSRQRWRESLPWKYGSVLVLKLVICPLAATYLLRFLRDMQTPYADKVPAAPLASVIEMGIKWATN